MHKWNGNIKMDLRVVGCDWTGVHTKVLPDNELDKIKLIETTKLKKKYIKIQNCRACGVHPDLAYPRNGSSCMLLIC
jgi:hypothetical protein